MPDINTKNYNYFSVLNTVYGLVKIVIDDLNASLSKFSSCPTWKIGCLIGELVNPFQKLANPLTQGEKSLARSMDFSIIIPSLVAMQL